VHSFLQQLVNGIDLGAIYALFAVGFTLIFGVFGILNLAQGSVLGMGTLAGYLVSTQFHANFLVTVIVGCLAGAIISVIIDVVAFRPLRRAKDAPQDATLVTSIGAALILNSILQQATNTEVKRFPKALFPSWSTDVGGVRISLLDITTLVTAVTLTVALVVYLRHTKSGRQIRAVSADPDTSRLLGIRPQPIYVKTFAMCGAFAGVAGVLIGVTYSGFSYSIGETYLLIGVAAIIVGGMGSVTGALVGGLGIGIVQVMTVQYVSSNWSFAGPFVLLFLVIVIRPTGLFGRFDVHARVGRYS